MSNGHSTSTSIASIIPAVNPNGRRHKAYMIDRTPPYSDLLQCIIQQMQTYMYLPDSAPLVLLLGAVAANMLPGTPVWLMLVASPSSGKTELLDSVLNVSGIYRVSTFTEAALLSGVPKSKWAKEAKGGLLNVVGSKGTLVAKDFTSVLAMDRNQRASALAALREIHDGYWKRDMGTDGGVAPSWTGKLGFLGGVTDAIDSHHAVIAALGDRFTYCRMEAESRDLVSRKVIDRCTSNIKNNSNNEEFKKEIQESVRCFIESLDLSNIPELDSFDNDWLSVTADIAARCRSAIERDNYTRQIVRVLKPESTGRLTGSLTMLMYGLYAIGCSHNQAVWLIRRVATDCMPTERSRLIKLLSNSSEGMKIGNMRQDTDIYHPETAIKRALEDMECLEIVQREQGHGKEGSDLWLLHPKFRTRWAML